MLLLLVSWSANIFEREKMEGLVLKIKNIDSYKWNESNCFFFVHSQRSDAGLFFFFKFKKDARWRMTVFYTEHQHNLRSVIFSCTLFQECYTLKAKILELYIGLLKDVVPYLIWMPGCCTQQSTYELKKWLLESSNNSSMFPYEEWIKVYEKSLWDCRSGRDYNKLIASTWSIIGKGLSKRKYVSIIAVQRI